MHTPRGRDKGMSQPTTKRAVRPGRPGGSARIFRAHRKSPMYARFKWGENIPIVARGRKVERLQHTGYAAEYRNVLRTLEGNLDPESRVDLESRKKELEQWFNRRENNPNNPITQAQVDKGKSPVSQLYGRATLLGVEKPDGKLVYGDVAKGELEHGDLIRAVTGKSGKQTGYGLDLVAKGWLTFRVMNNEMAIAGSETEIGRITKLAGRLYKMRELGEIYRFHVDLVDPKVGKYVARVKALTLSGMVRELREREEKKNPGPVHDPKFQAWLEQEYPLPEPPQPPPERVGNAPFIETDDGQLYIGGVRDYSHVRMAGRMGVHPSRIVRGGFFDTGTRMVMDFDSPNVAQWVRAEHAKARLAFKKGFGPRKAREGNPTRTLYHGSDLKFDSFRAAKYHPNKQLGFGIHLTSDKEFAAKYGRYVYTVAVNYNQLLDESKVYERGTPEFDLGIALLKGTQRERMRVYFEKQGVAPISLDHSHPRRSEKLVREHGFDLIKYNAVVITPKSPQYAVREGSAESYVALDPSQLRIEKVEEIGKKEYNPGLVKRFFGGVFGKAQWVISWQEFLDGTKAELVKRGWHRQGEPLEQSIVTALKEVYDGSVRAYRLGGNEAVEQYLEDVRVGVKNRRGGNPIDMASLLGMGLIAGATSGVVQPVVSGYMRGKSKSNPASPLQRRLMALREQMADAAQIEYDEWDQAEDEDGDCELGQGGICDRVAQQVMGVISTHMGDVEVIEGGQDGDDHSWVVVYDKHEAAGVDIPPGVYETGGGYSWKKRKGVEIQPGDVQVFHLNRADVVGVGVGDGMGEGDD